MSTLSARFFAFLHDAPFYRELHRQAVHLLPRGEDRLWLDVGCGPGLMARLAGERGYRAVGVDRDPAMVHAARIVARRSGSPASFETADLGALAERREKARVVSAASLLAVLDDRPDAMRRLLSGMARDGTLLLVEPSDRMTPAGAAQWRSGQARGRNSWLLKLWAHTRRPDRIVTFEDVRVSGHDTRRHELLDGLVNAWLIRRSS